MRKKLLCAVMCCVLICGTFAPKRAYAIAGVDDAAVVIVCALLAAAGVTFATNDGVPDAVQGFLDASAGKYDSTIERLASGYSVYGSVGAFKIPSMAMGGVRLLLEGLFDYFSVDDSRQGSVNISGGVDYGYDYVLPADDPAVVSYFQLSVTGDAPCYLFATSSYNSNPAALGYKISYAVVSSASFSYSYVSPSTGDFISGTAGRNTASFGVPGKYVYHPVGAYFWSTSYGVKSCDIFSCSPSVLACDYSTAVFPLTYDPIKTFIFNLLSDSFGVSELSIPYGLTFPEELTAPDVIDNFEQRVEAAAGDLAIVVPVDGVVDNTLPYAVAQEQYLVNVNELGEVTDTVTESNTWLQKILTAVKALPATVIGTGSLDFSCFSDIGLSSVFPFCIPFDLKNALMGFNVTPAEPIWEISFDGTFMSAAGSYILDMTKFEKLFAVVRFFIYGGFVVSLILLTRKIIKG